MGGGNAVAAWTIQALAPYHAVTVLSFRHPSLSEVDGFYGTDLQAYDIAWTLPARGLRAVREIFERVPTPLDVLKRQLLGRAAKQLAPQYDLVIATENELDFGVWGIQYVHYPWLTRRAGTGLRRLLLWPGAPLDLYYRLSFAVSRYDAAAMRRNLTLTNSDWTAGKIVEAHGIRARTLYPPVPEDVAREALGWEQREHGFVAVGRFATEKRLDRVLDIVAGLRAVGERVHLHLVGSRSAESTAVLRRARELPWVRVHEDLPRTALLALLGRHRYGLHAMQDEHFGIAVAEMVGAGCLPFVHDSGGQVEVVDRPELRYRDREDAIGRILSVLRSRSTQERLVSHFAAHGARFSSARFVRELREHVDEALGQQ